MGFRSCNGVNFQDMDPISSQCLSSPGTNGLHDAQNASAYVGALQRHRSWQSSQHARTSRCRICGFFLFLCIAYPHAPVRAVARAAVPRDGWLLYRIRRELQVRHVRSATGRREETEQVPRFTNAFNQICKERWPWNAKLAFRVESDHTQLTGSHGDADARRRRDACLL
jgi:hypothetical protein